MAEGFEMWDKKAYANIVFENDEYSCLKLLLRQILSCVRKGLLQIVGKICQRFGKIDNIMLMNKLVINVHLELRQMKLD